MRYYEIMHTEHETVDQRERRLKTMYGKGPSEEEFEEMEIETARVKNEVDRAKARQVNIDALKKLIDCGAYDLSDLDRDFPFPRASGRCLTEEERHAVWVRASLAAGKALPPLVTPPTE